MYIDLQSGIRKNEKTILEKMNSDLVYLISTSIDSKNTTNTQANVPYNSTNIFFTTLDFFKNKRIIGICHKYNFLK